MTKLALGVGAYNRSYAQQPEIKLVNRYFEENPTNQVDGVSLLSRPPTTLLDTVAAGSRIRGLFTQKGAFNGDLFVVAGNTLYRRSTAGVNTAISGILEDNGTVSMVSTGSRLFVSDGASLQYYVDAGALTTIAPPAGETFASLAVLAQYVICTVAGSQKWFYIRPGTVVINALDFYEAEQLPDNIIGARTVGDLVYFFGDSSTEPWYANGAGNADDPFSRAQGSAYSRGILDGTDVNIDREMVVVGDDDVVYLISGGQAIPISNHGVEELIRKTRKIERDAG